MALKQSPRPPVDQRILHAAPGAVDARAPSGAKASWAELPYSFPLIQERAASGPHLCDEDHHVPRCQARPRLVVESKDPLSGCQVACRQTVVGRRGTRGSSDSQHSTAVHARIPGLPEVAVPENGPAKGQDIRCLFLYSSPMPEIRSYASAPGPHTYHVHGTAEQARTVRHSWNGKLAVSSDSPVVGPPSDCCRETADAVSASWSSASILPQEAGCSLHKSHISPPANAHKSTHGCKATRLAVANCCRAVCATRCLEIRFPPAEALQSGPNGHGSKRCVGNHLGKTAHSQLDRAQDRWVKDPAAVRVSADDTIFLVKLTFYSFGVTRSHN